MEKLSVYPVENVPILWDESIMQILAPLPAPPPATLTEGQQVLVLLTLRGWEMGLHWMIKIYWDSRHRLPLRPSLVRAYRPHGDLLHAVRELAVRCHADQVMVGAKIPFPHAAAWYAAIVREIVTENVLASVMPIEKFAATRRKKEAIASLAMQPWLALRRYENPTDSRIAPATWLLYEVAIALAEGFDVWRKCFFRPYCDSGRQWVKATTGDGWSVAQIDPQGRAIVQDRAGRSAQIVPLPEAWKKVNRWNPLTEGVSGVNTDGVSQRG